MNRPRDSIYPPRSPTVLESKEIISAILPLSESCLRTNMAESKPIVILHVITTLGRGGAERQLVNLVSNTNRAKFEHIVCCLQPPTDLAPEIEGAGYKVINLNLRGKHPWLSGARKLASIMRIE